MTRRTGICADPILLAALALAACNSGAPADGNAAAANAAIEKPADQCTPPQLVMEGGQTQASDLLAETKANFATAYESACAKGLLKDRSLIDSSSSDQKHIFLVNAPEANVASIYLSDVDGSRMILEYPFLTTDGTSNVPTSAELEEAIYCAVVGATPEEQESTDRCLVD